MCRCRAEAQRGQGLAQRCTADENTKQEPDVLNLSSGTGVGMMGKPKICSRILTRPLGLSPYQLLGGLGVSSLGRALDPSQHTLKTKHRLLPVAAQVCGSTSCRLLDPSPWPQAHGETFRTSQYAKYTKHAKGPTLAWSFAHVLLPPGFSSLPSL